MRREAANKKGLGPDMSAAQSRIAPTFIVHSANLCYHSWSRTCQWSLVIMDYDLQLDNGKFSKPMLSTKTMRKILERETSSRTFSTRIFSCLY